MSRTVTHLRCKFDKITIVVEASSSTKVNQVKDRFWEAVTAAKLELPGEYTSDDIGIFRGKHVEGKVKWELMDDRKTVSEVQWKDGSMVGIGWKVDGVFQQPTINDPSAEEEEEEL